MAVSLKKSPFVAQPVESVPETMTGEFLAIAVTLSDLTDTSWVIVQEVYRGWND